MKEAGILLKMLLLGVALYLAFSFGMLTTYAATEKMVVLLDTSGSMKNNDPSRDAINWMKKVTALCVDKEIELSLVTFQGPPDEREKITVYSDNKQIDDEEFKLLETRIDQIEYNGNKTDHLAAVLKAEELLVADRADLSDSFLVILSDGNLDYVGRGIESHLPLTEEETRAVMEFEEHCRILAEKGCRIYLMEFGANIGIFQRMQGIPGFSYLKNSQDKTEDLENSLEGIFSQTQYPVENIAMGHFSGQNNPSCIQFSLYRPYDICTVFLGKNQRYQVSSSDINVISNGIDDIKFEVSDGTGVTILSMKNMKENTYQINLPPNIYGSYSIHTQNFKKSSALELQLFDKDNQMIQRTGDVCTVSAQYLPLTLRVRGAEENLQLYNIRYISGSSGKSAIMPAENGNVRLDESFFSEQSNWRFELINSTNGSSEDALTITFQEQVTDESQTEKEYCEAYTGDQKILIDEEIIQSGFDAGNLEIVVSPLDTNILDETSEPVYEINYNEVTVVFHQPGRYDVRMYDMSKGALLRYIEYDVSEQGIFSIEKSYVWIAGIGFILIVIVWIARKHRQSEE